MLVALLAKWSWSLQIWGRGQQPQVLSGAEGHNLLPWKGESETEARSEQQITQPVGTA